MRSIVVDGYNLGLEKSTGVATYGRNLCHAIKSMGHNVGVLYGGRSTKSKNPLLSEIAFFDGAVRPKPGIGAGPRMVLDALCAPLGCVVERVPVTGNVIYDSVKSRLPTFDTLWNSGDLFKRSQRSYRWFGSFSRVAVPDADIAHWTYPLPIRAVNAANVYTLHDLVPLRLPQTTLDNKRLYFSLCKRIVDTADHIVTVSETSRNDIIEILGAHPDKVTNTYQAVTLPQDALQKSEGLIRNELSGIFNLRYKEYFLFFGAIEPKKNINRILEAYLGSGVTTPLVIVGAPGWKSEGELALLKTLNDLPDFVRDRIVRLEYLPFTMLLTIIRGAKATVFPSLYEGFGLPVLESMLLGTPVITSKLGSLAEVAGDACILIDPYDSRALVDAIKLLDTNESVRYELTRKGLVQAKVFSSENYNKRLSEVYKLCGAKSHKR
jgi:glycosyltransferase involved in cell wall biosynthesis